MCSSTLICDLRAHINSDLKPHVNCLTVLPTSGLHANVLTHHELQAVVNLGFQLPEYHRMFSVLVICYKVIHQSVDLNMDYCLYIFPLNYLSANVSIRA